MPCSESEETKDTLRLLLALALVKSIGIIAIGMILYFRGQWMEQTEDCIHELAVSCETAMQIAGQNRESIERIKEGK